MFKAVMVAIGCLCFAMPTDARAQSSMEKLADGVYHFFSDWYGSLVVVGENSVLVVDPAWTKRAEQLKAAVAGLTDKPVTHVVLTHEHYDHVGGTEVFKGAAIVCHASCEKTFALDVLNIAPKRINLSFENILVIDLGNKIVELQHLGAGDGVATTVIHVPQDQVVATADLYQPQSLTAGIWIGSKNYLGTRKILNELRGWPLKHAISGHSKSTDPSALLENAEFVNDLYTAVKAELDKAIAEGGMEAAFNLLGDSLPAKVKLPKYQSWSGYEEYLPAHVWRMGISILSGR